MLETLSRVMVSLITTKLCIILLSFFTFRLFGRHRKYLPETKTEYNDHNVSEKLLGIS
jgi:hypothetical protein